MDYQSEQDMEVEALESILMEDFGEVQGASPSGWPDDARCYRIGLPTGHEEAEALSGASKMQFDILFAHTAAYPDEAPLLKISNVQGMSNEDLKSLQSLVEEQIQENLGMAMIYTIVTAAQEWMLDKADVPDEVIVDPEEAKRRALEAEEARLAAQRAHGTQVTPENFASWRTQFDQEQTLHKLSLAQQQQAADKAAKLTGKQFFQSQEAQAETSEPSDFEDDFEEDMQRDAEGSADDDDSLLDDSDEEDVLAALS